MTLPLPAQITRTMVRNGRQGITGVILAGGKSRRMGKDKAFLEFSGKPLFERVLEMFRESVHRILEEPAHPGKKGTSFVNIRTPEEFARLGKRLSS